MASQARGLCWGKTCTFSDRVMSAKTTSQLQLTPKRMPAIRPSSMLLFTLVFHERQPRGDHPASGALVHHVDVVVLPIRAGEAEENAEPAPEAEVPLVRERA